MILGFILLQDDKSIWIWKLKWNCNIFFFCQNNTFQKQCREERTLALASHVPTHTRKHKNSFTSAPCCVHAHKEMSHCITRDETIRIREHYVFILTQPSKVIPRHTSGSVKTWPVSIRPENSTLLQNMSLVRRIWLNVCAAQPLTPRRLSKQLTICLVIFISAVPGGIQRWSIPHCGRYQILCRSACTAADKVRSLPWDADVWRRAVSVHFGQGFW